MSTETFMKPEAERQWRAGRASCVSIGNDASTQPYHAEALE